MLQRAQQPVHSKRPMDGASGSTPQAPAEQKSRILSSTLFTVLQNELQDFVVEEKDINLSTNSEENDGRLRERQETKYSNLLCALVYFTATDRDGTVHAARGAQVLKRALNSHKLRHFVKNIVPKADKVQAATKVFDNMKEVLRKISKNTTNAARQLRTTMLACVVSSDLDNKEKKMLSRCLLDENATKMQKARIHKQLKEASKRRSLFFRGEREHIWESSRAKRKDALSDEVIASVQKAIIALTRRKTTGRKLSESAKKSGGAKSANGSSASTRKPSETSSSASPVGVQDCTDTQLHKKVLKYLNDQRKGEGQKEFKLSVDRFRIIKRGMGNIKRSFNNSKGASNTKSTNSRSTRGAKSSRTKSNGTSKGISSTLTSKPTNGKLSSHLKPSGDGKPSGDTKASSEAKPDKDRNPDNDQKPSSNGKPNNDSNPIHNEQAIRSPIGRDKSPTNSNGKGSSDQSVSTSSVSDVTVAPKKRKASDVDSNNEGLGVPPLKVPAK